jgi:hypothetical protein
MVTIEVNILREQMMESRKAGLPEYNWIPPIWDKTDPPVLTDTTDAEPKKLAKEPVDLKYTEGSPGEDSPDPLSGDPRKWKHGFHKWIHPASTTDHTDPPLWDDDDQAAANASDLPADQLAKLKKIVGRESLGMERLACVFQWALCQASALLAEVNEGLGKGKSGAKANQKRYEKARADYIEFLRDLDDHEPFTRQHGTKAAGPKKDPVEPGKPGNSGYGHSMKWVYIYPIIFERKIWGAKVSIHWNPHSSSNGIPIQHA